MAEENITEVQRQLSAAMLQVQRDLAQFGQVTQQSAEQLKDAQMKAKFGSESYTKGINAAGQALGALAGAGIEGAKAMYQGKKDATAFNSSLGELSKAATLAGTALTLMMPGGIIMKGIVAAVTMFTGAVIATVQAANEMNAKLYKGYEGLSKSGAAASDGMTGVFNDAKKLGLSMDQLDSYVGLVAENSQELAMFAGSVAGGRKKFADMGEALESSRVGFFAMGISQEEQNQGMMRFTKTMTQAGRAQTMTSKELADGARSYIMEQDKLAKLTGISAQKQQALLDRARENEQFNAKIRSLELEGTAESKAAADGLRKGLIIAAAAGDDAAEGFMASVNGNLRNEKARELNMTAQGEQMRSIQNILNGMDPAQAMQPMFKSMSNFEKTTGIALNQLGAGSGIFLKSSTMANASNLANMTSAEMVAKIDKDTALQQAGAGDAMTKEEARQIKERQDQNKKAEQAVFANIQNAQAVNAKLLGVTNSLTDAFTALTSAVNKVLNFFGLGPAVSKTEEKQTEITDTEKELKTAKAAQKTATTPEQKAASDREVKFYTEKLALLNEEKKTIAAEEENAAYEKEVLKRANDEVKIKKAAYDKAMVTATTGQKLGFGLDKDQEKAKTEMWEAVQKQRDVAQSDSKRKAAVTDLKTSGYKPPSPGSSASGGGNAAAAGDGGGAPAAASGPEPHAAAGGGGATDTKPKLAQITSKSGKTASVGEVYAGPFQKLIDYLDNAGYDIASLGGYVDRDVRGKPGVKSVHAKGGAIDINPDANPMGSTLVTDMPENIGKVASDLGLGWGGNWQRVKDAMHFSGSKSEGGSITAEEGIQVDGPETGYPATLHGKEAVIPMQNGSGDFVKLFEDIAMMMGKQVGAIDELIRVAKNGNDIQTKILRIQS